MKRGDDADEPTLGEAWAMLGERLGLEVEVRGERSSRNQRQTWHTVLSVGCANDAGTGTLESAVDVRDPAWNPREYDPRASSTSRRRFPGRERTTSRAV